MGMLGTRARSLHTKYMEHRIHLHTKYMGIFGNLHTIECRFSRQRPKYVSGIYCTAHQAQIGFLQMQQKNNLHVMEGDWTHAGTVTAVASPSENVCRWQGLGMH